jgi:hypothetical protein
MKLFFLSTTAVVLLSTNLFPLVKAADNSIALGGFDSSAFEVIDPIGTSTVTVTYDVGGATMGNDDQAGTDFYIGHQLLAKDCGAAYAGSAPVNLSTNPDSTTTASKTVSTLTNTAAWEPGTYEFCLQYTLYMLGPTTPFTWQVKGFNIKVDVTYDDNQTIVHTTSATNVALVANAETNLGTAAVPKAGVAPVLGSVAIGGDGSFAYEEDLVITWLYVHTLDYYDYVVDEASILLIDPADDLQVEYPGTTPVTFADTGGSVAYVQTGTFATSDLGGQITINVPLKVYQAGLTTLKIQFTVQYSLKTGLANPVVRRNLRSLSDGDDSEVMDETAYLKSGTFDEVMTVELAALSDEYSGATGAGYSIQVVSAMCLAGGAALFM